jgi:Ca2+-binding EF-hand superfamily protein
MKKTNLPEEIIMGLDQKPYTKEEIGKAFEIFDVDGDGFISEKDLYEVMIKLEPDISQNTVREMIRDTDLNNDGKIDLKEFTNMMISSFRSSQTESVSS